MAKRGRKSAYDTIIKPRFSDISEWLRNGATEKQVCENLGISKDAFYKYKKEKAEFNELIKKSRQSLVIQLRGALVKRALGYTYTEKRKTTGIDPDGRSYIKNETTEKNMPPDVAALNLCLKNYDPDNWANDPQMLELKRAELELRKELAERDNF